MSSTPPREHPPPPSLDGMSVCADIASRPKMARLPSLQQISSRLNGSTSATANVSGETTPTPTTANGASSASAPKLSLATNVPPSASATSPFASSPSGRLKLPASAMKRTQSQQGQTTLLAESSTGSSFFNTAEPAQSPAPVDPVTATAATMSTTAPVPPPLTRGMSTDAYIKGYKDVPSLAQIKSHVKGKEVNGDAEKENKSGETTGQGAVVKADPISRVAADEVEKEDKGKGRMAEPDVSDAAKTSSGTYGSSIAPAPTAATAAQMDLPLEHTWYDQIRP